EKAERARVYGGKAAPGQGPVARRAPSEPLVSAWRGSVGDGGQIDLDGCLEALFGDLEEEVGGEVADLLDGHPVGARIEADPPLLDAAELVDVAVVDRDERVIRGAGELDGHRIGAASAEGGDGRERERG